MRIFGLSDEQNHDGGGSLQERISAYLHSLSCGQGAYLDSIRQKAEAGGVPIIRIEMESFLASFLELVKPAAILEAGTAVGYSSMLMAKLTEISGCRIDTVEKDDSRFREACDNISASPWKNRIHPIHGDVQDVFHSLVTEGKKYDFIFMDAAKGQYIHYLPDAAALLRTGGVLVSDNVLQDMTILDSHFALERRERTIHKRMRDYLYELTHHPGLLTTVVPIGDGAAVTIRKEDYA